MINYIISNSSSIPSTNIFLDKRILIVYTAVISNTKHLISAKSTCVIDIKFVKTDRKLLKDQ